MDIFMVLCWAIVIGLLLFLYDFILTVILKYTAHRRTGGFWFVHHLIPRYVACPNLKESPYWGRFPRTKSLAYDATVNDPVMQELATTLKGRTRFMSARGKASYVLSMIQQNVTYRTDSETFGSTERYCFPACTMYLRGNDCEDSALLGAGLCKLLGLDVAMIRVTGHVAYGVAVSGWGKKFQHDGATYIWCETTSMGPIGMYGGNMDILAIEDIQEPPADFIENDTIEDGFEQYKK